MRAASSWTLAALGCALLTAEAGAVIGGSADAGALSRSTVMVLNSRGGVCSAVVLGPDTLLTAAHCAASAEQHRVHFKRADGSPALLAPAAIAVHPGYDRGAVAGRRPSVDLALVRIGETLPDAFAPAGLSSAVPPRDTPVTLGGYGVAQEGDGRSGGTFRTAGLVTVEPYGPGRILLWASDPNGARSGACQGDSGGPIAIGNGAVAAVATWATGKGRNRCGNITQGVLLAPHRAWIDRILSDWGGGASWR